MTDIETPTQVASPVSSSGLPPKPKDILSDDVDDDDDDEEEETEEVKAWDEGGPSDCGYGETVHQTLMNVGAKVHGVVGDPGEKISSVQKSIGNWFQELSYATRDIVRGEKDLKQDAADAVKTLMGGGKEDEAEEKDDEAAKKVGQDV